MKVSEELDAIQISGLNIIEVLVLPRMLGIIITLPLLTFYSSVMGLIGGAAMCCLNLGITVPAFLHQLQTVVSWTFWVGLIKSPVFAFIIALVGCHQGFEVERNAWRDHHSPSRRWSLPPAACWPRSELNSEGTLSVRSAS